jgi:acetyl esterase/lipase
MNKKLIPILPCLLLFSPLLQAQEKVIQLYPGKAPGSESWTWEEKISDKNMFSTVVVYNVVQPTITVFPADPVTANGTSVIIAPGGGFHTLSINSEGTDVARYLNTKGVTAFVLKYRLVHSLTDDPVKELMGLMGKRANFDSINAPVVVLAMNDGLSALAYIRAHAAELKIDPGRIGFMGFSAGGTLTMSVVYNATEENRPNFIAPIYAYTGAVIGSAMPKEKTPAFIVAATDDQLGLAPNSVDIYSKWIVAKQPAELHMYARGGHGFGMRKQNIPTDNWIDRFAEWLEVQGYLKTTK